MPEKAFKSIGYIMNKSCSLYSILCFKFSEVVYFLAQTATQDFHTP